MAYFLEITMKKLLSLMFFSIFCCLSCDGGGSSSFDPEKSSYGEGTETSTGKYYASVLQGGTKAFVAKKTGTVMKGSTELSIITATSDESTREVLVSPFPLNESDDTVIFGGYTSTSGMSITADTPAEIDLLPPVGEDVPFNKDFTATFPGMTISSNFNFNGSYQLVSEDATVQTPYGTYSGLRYYTAKGAITGTLIPAVLKDGNLTGELWISPTLGIIAYKIPEFGIGGNMESTWDYGDPNETGFKTIRKSGFIDTANPNFLLDTYDIAGKNDADKNTHAKMLLEIRYVDEELAKTGAMPVYPTLTVEFGVPLGYFPHQLFESPVSIFHPEENGKGYKYFIGFVDQAAKNNAMDPISYHISVRADPNFAPAMRVTARIYYNKIQ